MPSSQEVKINKINIRIPQKMEELPAAGQEDSGFV
jgi:hypothetical protein